MTDYVLTGHKCEPVARMIMDEGRDWWLGRLTEPIAEYPRETHCLHITTPLKSVVFGIHAGDASQLTVLMRIVHGAPVNPTWVERMVGVMKKRAAPVGQLS